MHDYTTLSDWQFVGFVEEPTKVLPLILLLIFARPAVNGTRDGLIYGALGGLGFAMLESSAYFALVNYADLGWSSLFTETIGRASFLGTDIHILFAATVGAAIGFGVSTKKRWLGILVIIGGFLLVALTHGQQDHTIGKILAVGGSVVGAYVVMGFTGIPMEQLSQIQGTPWYYILLSIGSTINLVGINLINLIILFIALWKSGNTERRTVREQLKGEPESVITPEEYAGVETEHRLHLRSFKGYSKKMMRKVRGLRNELAFRKYFVERQGRTFENDPPAVAIREEIATLRSAST